ncbi:hypothetical protein [Hymenobacter glacialis]|uniref:Uncharacterized protein n=1 Tax=Hymenobacter glacialis TaxID=1908236 RepID=A0A1G1T4G2_9BACT|nr:hypothetical protein [Hymenobacter glacialis]OGX85759.1 hypothetical protein BEN48_14255 [Hymenobacter glacialis]
MRFLLIGLLVAAATPVAFAQAALSPVVATDPEYINRELAKGKGHSNMAADGTPFLMPYWSRGNVLMTTGRVPRPWLKYDLAKDRLLWRRSPTDSLELDTSLVTEFSLADSLRGKIYTYRRYLAARIASYPLRTAFFEVNYDEGKSALLRRRTRTILGGSNGPSLAGRQAGKWEETSTFYLKNSDNVIEPVKLNAKAVLTTLGKAKAPLLTAYVTRERLDLSQETDVVKLLRYYDSL